MAIRAQCRHCGYVYTARDDWAGKKVRCRKCGLIFAVPEVSDPVVDEGGLALQEEPAGPLSVAPTPPVERPRQSQVPQEGEPITFDDLSDGAAQDGADDTRIGSADGTTTDAGAESDEKTGAPVAAKPPAPQIRKIESNMSGGVGSAKSFLPRPDQDPGAFDLEGDAPMSEASPSPFNFPFSGELDLWLPRAAPVLFLAWVAYLAYTWSPGPIDEKPMPSWSGFVPLGTLLLLFVAVWWSAFVVAVRKTVLNLKTATPDRERLRAASLAVVPFAMATLFWLGSESTVFAIIGSLLGAGVTTLQAWFLLRLKERDVIYAGMAMVVCTIIAAGISIAVIGVSNLIVYQALHGSDQAAMFAVSPFGPGLSWPKYDEAQAKPKPRGTPVAPTPQKVPGAIATPTPQPSPGVLVPASLTPAGNNPTAGNNSPPPPQPGPAVAPRPESPTAMTPAPVFAPPPANNAADAEDARLRKLLAESPFLEAARVVPTEHSPLRIVFPALGGNVVAVITPAATAGEYTVELHDVAANKTVHKIPFSGNPKEAAYAISPTGEMLSRVTTFPVLSIQTYSVSRNRFLESYDLSTLTVAPRLIGYVAPNMILCANLAPGAFQISALDVVQLKSFPGLWMRRAIADRPASHLAASAAGPWVGTILTTPEGRVDFASYSPDVRYSSRFTVDRIDAAIASNPSGIAPSPDGTKVAIAYEQAGQLSIYELSLKDRRVIGRFDFPGGLGLQDEIMPAEENRLLWLADGPVNAMETGRRWLYAGRILIGGANTTVQAMMELGKVSQQAAGDGKTVHLVVPRGTENLLLELTFKAAGAPASRPEVAP